MVVTIDKIITLLKSKNIDLSVKGDNISVEKLAAIGSDVREAICYYDGDDPSVLKGIQDSIVFCKPELELDPENKNTYVYTKHPQLCFYHISKMFELLPDEGIHKQSIVNNLSTVGQNVSIGPFCEIEECTIGDSAIIESGVKIHKNTVIGKNVHIQANSVIGAIGVMWAWDDQGEKIKCVQTGHVIIEDNVFIGSGVTIVRGAFENKPTVIGKHTMIAHGTAIGHGSIIGKSNHLANNVTIGGSVQTGKNCFLGSGSTVRPKINLPENTLVGAGAVVVKDFSKVGLTLIGNPATKMNKKKAIASGVPAPYLHNDYNFSI
jgi:UDP-3-O-[3-hydroxymyristoyl] glucosamine N-acyltransferase